MSDELRQRLVDLKNRFHNVRERIKAAGNDKSYTDLRKWLGLYTNTLNNALEAFRNGVREGLDAKVDEVSAALDEAERRFEYLQKPPVYKPVELTRPPEPRNDPEPWDAGMSILDGAREEIGTARQADPEPRRMVSPPQGRDRVDRIRDAARQAIDRIHQSRNGSPNRQSDDPPVYR